jgi:hypothetical protein
MVPVTVFLGGKKEEEEVVEHGYGRTSYCCKRVLYMQKHPDI